MLVPGCCLSAIASPGEAGGDGWTAELLKYKNIECRTRNFEYRSMESLRSVLVMYKNDRIPYFDIHNSTFDIKEFLA
jgi:hypothetical protein